VNYNAILLEPERQANFTHWWADAQRETLFAQLEKWRQIALLEAADLRSKDMSSAGMETFSKEKLQEAEKFQIALDVLKGVDTQQLIARIEL